MAKTTKGQSGIARTEVVATIFRLFIRPLLNEFIIPLSSTDNQLHSKLEMWFCKNDRDIWIVKAKYPFNITGPRWVTTSTPEKLYENGTGDRAVAKGDYMYVRTDAKRPDVVEIEFKEQIFVTRSTDWQVLSEKVEFIR